MICNNCETGFSRTFSISFGSLLKLVPTRLCSFGPPLLFKVLENFCTQPFLLCCPHFINLADWLCSLTGRKGPVETLMGAKRDACLSLLVKITGQRYAGFSNLYAEDREGGAHDHLQ